MIILGGNVRYLSGRGYDLGIDNGWIIYRVGILNITAGGNKYYNQENEYIGTRRVVFLRVFNHLFLVDYSDYNKEADLLFHC